MQKKITITGDLGSGKSSVCKILHAQLGFEVVSVGSIQRQLAEQHKMSITEFNRYMETHPEIDLACDREVAKLGESVEGLVFDSRLAWHFVPQALKVYLRVDPAVAAKRILTDMERKNEEQSHIDTVKERIAERRKSEVLRFKMQYGVDLELDDNYDLIIDTSDLSIAATAQIILDAFAKFCSDQPFQKHFR